MPSEEPDSQWTGRIESLAPDGTGIGTVEERAADGQRLRRPIFIPYTAPDDRVEALIRERKGKYLFGELSRIIDPSAHRIAPTCPHYQVCGGCDWQHLSYDEQLRQKARIIAHRIAKAGVQLPSEVTVLPSKERHRYRQRARIAVRFANGGCVAGFRKRRSREIVPVGTCVIVDQAITDLIIALNKSADAPSALEGKEIEILAVVGEKGKLGILARIDGFSPQEHPEIRAWLERMYARDRKLIGNALIADGRSVRALGQVQEHFTYSADGITYGFSPEMFIQSNIATDELLIDRAMAMLINGRDAKAMTVIDLYAGIGNLSLPAARRCARVIAVEGNETSVHAANANALRNAFTNVTVLHRSIERYLKEHERWKGQDPQYPIPDAVLLDPPRTGLSDPVRAALLTMLPERIIYVSCDPTTLARDLQELTVAYGLNGIVGIDMFPDTSDVETVCVLDRKG